MTGTPPDARRSGWWRAARRARYRLRQVWRHPDDRLRARLGGSIRVLRCALMELLSRPIIVRVGDRSRFVVRHDDTNSPRAVVHPLPDWTEMRVWQRALGSGDLFVDVGANVGMYTLLVAERDCEVIAVEPVPRSVERLRTNLDLNGYRVRVVQAAATDQPGTMRITDDLDSHDHLLLGGEGGIEIPTVTIDDLVGGRHVAGMKIDVQGAERLVLMGSVQALTEHRIDLIQIEWNEQSHALLGEPRSRITDLLADVGYVLLRADGDGELIPAAGDVAEGRRDMFAMPAPRWAEIAAAHERV